ncbi:MAG: endonuclease III domain-containing protein [Planctomycetales bacterium]|nr:endonuclease III domain-containing protein [Planctomycetales bacterium]
MTYGSLDARRAPQLGLERRFPRCRLRECFTLTTILQDVFDRLLERFGPQGWWPGESPFEVMLGAVLVQNTSWKNVERAIANLRDADLLAPEPLFELRVEELAELIRPAGYYQVKARRLRNLMELLFDRFDGSLEAMFAVGLTSLREELLAVKGIGPETADAILLYAAELPAFVVDSYTHRVLARHGWIDFDADYHQIQEHFESALPQDVPLFNEYHALLVEVGKRFCKKTPACDECPLFELLPDGGAREPD